VFALLRWDQMPELADLIRKHAGGSAPTWQHVTDALREVGEEISRLEYYSDDGDAYAVWAKFWEQTRQDFGPPMLGVQEDRDAGTDSDELAEGNSYIDMRRAAVEYEGDRCALLLSDRRLYDNGLLVFTSESTPSTKPTLDA